MPGVGVSCGHECSCNELYLSIILIATLQLRLLAQGFVDVYTMIKGFEIHFDLIIIQCID